MSNMNSNTGVTTIQPIVDLTSASETSGLTSVTLTGYAQAQGAASLIGTTGAFAELFGNGGVNPIAQAVINTTTGAFTFTDVPLGVGANNFTVQVTDNFGNTGTSNIVTDTRVAGGPSITFDPYTATGTSVTQTISGTVTTTDGASLQGSHVNLD